MLRHYPDNLDRRWITRLARQVDKAASRAQRLDTAFLDPRQQKLALELLKQQQELNYLFFWRLPGGGAG